MTQCISPSKPVRFASFLSHWMRKRNIRTLLYYNYLWISAILMWKMENYMDRNDGCNESDILFYIEWAQQREPSIQFHIESILNGVWVRHYSALNGGRQTPNVHCLFLFNGTHSFLLNSACGSELNGSRQSPNVRCLFLYRWYTFIPTE